MSINNQNSEIEKSVESTVNQTEVGRFYPYDPQIELPTVTGMRVVKCLFQTSKKTGKKVADSAYTYIPTNHLDESVVIDRIKDLSPYVLDYLQGIEKEMIKKDYSKGLEYVYVDGLSIDKIIAYMEEKDLGSRLSGQKIEEWFMSKVSISLYSRFHDKIGTDDKISEAKVHRVVETYKNKFISLASGKTILIDSDKLALISVIEQCCDIESDLIAERLVKRLESMKDKESDLLEML